MPVLDPLSLEVELDALSDFVLSVDEEDAASVLELELASDFLLLPPE